MSFTWDQNKRLANIEAHGVDFEDAIYIWEAPVIEREDSRQDYGEQRFQAVGEVDGRVLLVVYTPRDGGKRIISARIARRDERAAYRAALSGRAPESG